MNKTLLILKNEVITLTSRFSFWFGVFGLPIIGFLVLAGIGYINRTQGGDETAPSPLAGVGQAFTQEEDTRPQGYVDLSGLIQSFPSGFPREQLITYTSQEEARAALDAGEISEFYVIPADYLKTGRITVYAQEFNLIAAENHSGNLSYLLDYNLLGSDERLTDAVRDPIANLDRTSIAPPEASLQRDREGMAYFWVPYAVMLFFYMAILGSSGLMLNSIAKEKENRILEVLLNSARPHEILLGKILGLGLVGLFQVLIWIISSVLLLQFGGQQTVIPQNVQLPPSIIVWGIVFFVLGYMVYASLMAGLGALVPNLREASQATMVVILPLMIPLFLLSALIESPNGSLAVGISLFPLTAPTTMMMRLSAAQIPLWQPIVAALLLLVTAYFIIRAVSNMFRAQTLLSGQPFKVKRFFLALLGR